MYTFIKIILKFNIMSATKVLSARVPVDVFDMFTNMCKHNNMNKNQMLSNMVQQPTTLMSTGGVVSIQDHKLPKEMKNILSAVGGVAVGGIVYHLLKNYLPKDKFTQEQIDDISGLCAIASGLGTMIFAHNRLNVEK
jgi:hypothetical protein